LSKNSQKLLWPSLQTKPLCIICTNPVGRITYNVLVQTLNPAQSICTNPLPVSFT